jgi:molybdopterin biosynthesis enzyme MoaB
MADNQIQIKKYENQIAELVNDVAGLREKIGKIDAILRSGREIERLDSAISNAVILTEKRFSGLAEEMGRVEVKRIDLAKIESKVVAFRNEMEKFVNLPGDIEQIKESLLAFRKKSLTRYNFMRLERWMKEIENELLELISMKAELTKLGDDAKSRLNKIEKKLPQHDRALGKLKRRDYRALSKFEDRLAKQMDSLSKEIKYNQNEISRLNEKIKMQSKLHKGCTGTKAAKKKPAKLAERFKNWLLQESK